jgi:hypothetical protein
MEVDEPIALFRPEPVVQARVGERFEKLKSRMSFRRQIEGRKRLSIVLKWRSQLGSPLHWIGSQGNLYSRCFERSSERFMVIYRSRISGALANDSSLVTINPHGKRQRCGNSSQTIGIGTYLRLQPDGQSGRNKLSC